MARGNHALTGARATVDEQRVLDALVDYLPYALDPDDLPDATWFTASSSMYEAYCDHMAKEEPNGHVLPASNFGRALVRVKGVDPVFKRRHWIVRRDGRRVQEWGYIGIQGPKSVPVPTLRGSRLVTKRKDTGVSEQVQQVPEGEGGEEAMAGEE